MASEPHVVPRGAESARLDQHQRGHLRHIVRLANQLPGDWSYMGPFDASQEGDDAYRYQLAYMAYALSLVQYHRTPAYRELWRETMARLIQKMLRWEVWGYWELTSRGSKVMDPELESLGDGWVDPVGSKNIMYSGHLLAMVGLYEMLYRDGRYSKPGALKFAFRPVFRGLGPEDYDYDHSRLVQAIYAQFQANDFIGCECEPNGIFVYCNQFPLLGFVHYDLVNGTSLSEEAIPKFEAAWQQRSDLFRQTDDPDLPVFYMVRQDSVVTENAQDNLEAVSALSWGPQVHAWRPEYVERLYPVARDRVIRPQPHGTITVDLARHQELHRAYQAEPSAELVDPMMLGVHTLGMLALSATELGDDQTRDAVLAFADKELSPTWRDGGLFYPRNDDLASGRYMTRVTGNALLAAARLGVKDGFWNLYNRPWGEGDLAGPEVVNVPYPAVEVTRADVDETSGVLSIEFDQGPVPTDRATFGFRVVRLRPDQRYEVVIDGQLRARIADDNGVADLAGGGHVAAGREPGEVELVVPAAFPKLVEIRSVA